MKTPGPDHPITLSTDGPRMRVRYANHVIADSARAVRLSEADYPPVVYFPREDVETGFLSKTEKTTQCPYKGDATYYSAFINSDLLENVAWSYEDPYPAVEQIRGLIAFYSDRVEVYPVTEEELADRHAEPLVEKWPEGPNA